MKPFLTYNQVWDIIFEFKKKEQWCAKHRLCLYCIIVTWLDQCKLQCVVHPQQPSCSMNFSVLCLHTAFSASIEESVDYCTYSIIPRPLPWTFPERRPLYLQYTMSVSSCSLRFVPVAQSYTCIGVKFWATQCVTLDIDSFSLQGCPPRHTPRN